MHPQTAVTPIKTISILGCGWFGLALGKKLTGEGYSVKGSTTTPDKCAALEAQHIQPYLIRFTAENNADHGSFFDSDVLFICIPPKRNSTELHDYPAKIKAIFEVAKNKVKHIILISSTHVYGDENQVINEFDPPHPDTESGKVILAAEQLFNGASEKNNQPTYTIVRFAGLVGPNRNPGQFFEGKKDIPNGLAPVNLIHQADAVGIACRLIERQAFGRTYHACSPHHPLKKDFYTAAATESGLTRPEFMMEKNKWKIVESVHVPAFLAYSFVGPDLL